MKFLASGFFKVFFCLCLVLSFAAISNAGQQPKRLIFGSWGPPQQSIAIAFEEWKKDFQESTKGQYTVDISYGSALGKAPEYYDLTVKGICDIGWIGLPYTKGRFPISELLQLPYVVPSAQLASEAYTDLYAKGFLKEEFSEVEVLFLFALSTSSVMTRSKPPSPLESAQGMKIKTSGGLTEEVTKRMGFTPVFMPVAEAYVATQKGVLDGWLLAGGAIKPFRAHELMKYASAPGFQSYPLAVVMNKRTFNNFSKEIQKIIVDMRESGKYMRLAGNADDKGAEEGWELFRQNGGEVVNWSVSDLKQITEKLKPIWDKYIREKEARGLPAQRAVDAFYTYLEARGVKQPAVGYAPKK